MPICNSLEADRVPKSYIPAAIHFSQQLTLPGFSLRNLTHSEKPLSKVTKKKQSI